MSSKMFSPRLASLGRVGLASLGWLLMPVVLGADAAMLGFTGAYTLTAEGARSPIGRFPSTELEPGEEPASAFVFEFDIDRLPYPLGSAMLSLHFAKSGKPASAPSSAVDLYIMTVATPDSVAAVRARGRFVGSSVLSFREVKAVARINLAEALNATKPSDRIALVALPVGVAGRSPAFAVATAPAPVRTFPAVGIVHERTAALMSPLWRGSRTMEEAVIFYADHPGAVAETRLLHRPTKIERVFSHLTGKDYIEGKDWSVDADGTLRALPGTSLPIGRGEDLYPRMAGRDFKTRQTTDGRTLIITETWSYPLTLMVNYRHEDDWRGPVPASAATALRRTVGKLRAREPVRIVVIGDSIASSGRGSATALTSPYGPTWPELFVAQLRSHFGGPVTLLNRALGSTVSAWGAANAASVLAPAKPDLVVIAFGMNDQRKTTPEKFRENLETMMREVRQTAPEAEFILVSSMVNNPIVSGEQPLVEFRGEMQKLAGQGAAIADVTAITRHLLQRKPFIDISVNNFNHPNDYLLRWYAQTAAELLIGGTGK